MLQDYTSGPESHFTQSHGFFFPPFLIPLSPTNAIQQRAISMLTIYTHADRPSCSHSVPLSRCASWEKVNLVTLNRPQSIQHLGSGRCAQASKKSGRLVPEHDVLLSAVSVHKSRLLENIQKTHLLFHLKGDDAIALLPLCYRLTGRKPPPRRKGQRTCNVLAYS